MRAARSAPVREDPMLASLRRTICQPDGLELRLHRLDRNALIQHPAGILCRPDPLDSPALGRNQTGQQLQVPEEELASSAVFRAFLSESLDTLGGDLVLIIDPLEAIPTDLVQALLTSLRAAYMDQQDMEYQVTVVVSGAFSLATLTVGESRPSADCPAGIHS